MKRCKSFFLSVGLTKIPGFAHAACHLESMACYAVRISTNISRDGPNIKTNASILHFELI